MVSNQCELYVKSEAFTMPLIFAWSNFVKIEDQSVMGASYMHRTDCP